MTKTLGTKFPQSRFSFDCKRLDVITCIRHDPNADEYQNLLVSSTSNIADFNVLLDTYEDYMFNLKTAKIISEVVEAMKGWSKLVIRLEISKREMDMFAGVLDKR
jgi:hypothetical protein